MAEPLRSRGYREGQDIARAFLKQQGDAGAPTSPETTAAPATGSSVGGTVMDLARRAASGVADAVSEAASTVGRKFMAGDFRPPSPVDTIRRIVTDPLNPPRPDEAFDAVFGEGASRRAGAFASRTLPGLFPNPFLSMPLSAAGEAGAQIIESGKITDPTSIGVAAAVPPVVTAIPRAVRAAGRTITRVIPGRFEAAQRAAREAGQEMVEGLRPTVDVAALSKSARAAGGDLIQTHNITKTLGEINIPANPANPKLEAVRTTMENLREAIRAQNPGTKARPGGFRVSLDDLEAIRRDIGPLVGRSGSPPEMAALYKSIVQDLEATAAGGGVGAQLAREAATAFKQDLGATKVAELVEKATTNRVISGAEVPALNVATLMKLTREPKTRQQLTDQLGPDGLRVIDRFVRDFRGLPPDVAYNGWGRIVTTLGAGAGGMAAGSAIAGAPGMVIGAITPEFLTNMAVVGANPRWLNQLMVTAVQGARASVTGRGQE